MSNANLTDQEIALLAKGLNSNSSQPLKNRLHKKISLEILIPLLALCAWNINLLILKAIHIRSTSDLTGNRHHNHQWQSRKLFWTNKTNITFTDVKDNLSANRRRALQTLTTNNEINLKKSRQRDYYSCYGYNSENRRTFRTSLQREIL